MLKKYYKDYLLDIYAKLLEIKPTYTNENKAIKTLK